VAPEPKGSSLHLREPATGPYAEPTESTPYLQDNLPKMHSDSILPSTTRFSEWSLSSGFPTKTLHFSLLSYACHMPRPPHYPSFHLPNNILGWVQNMKLPIVQLPPFSCYSILFVPNILLRTLFSNTFRLCSSLNVSDQVSHPYKNTGRIMVLYILTFTFLDSTRKDKRLNGMVARILRIW
jgi:hypothetical protein